LTVCHPKAVIVDSPCLPYIEAALPAASLGRDHLFQYDPESAGRSSGRNLVALMKGASGNDPPTTSSIHRRDRCVYMFSSGTTGLPKAIWWDNTRFLYQGRVFDLALNLGPDDVIFAPTPLYHNLACGLSWSCALCQGRPMVLARRFSASQYWQRAARYGATVGFYVGEIPRYLLGQPPSPADRAHRLKKMAGAGLRKEIWQEFQERFGIEDIFEFYGQSETPGAFFNVTREPGMIGRLISDCPLKVVQYDVEREEFRRGSDGLCRPCEVGEAGMVVAIPDADVSMYYVDPAAAASKQVRNVFAPEDCYIVTGDLVRCHQDGYVSFEDRLGATFRWKGHNVSTQEVETILAQFEGVYVSSVFGVKVPGAEGAIGMAAIQRRQHVPWDWSAFERFVAASLPRYAIPGFIRFQDKIETTGGTFKVTKGELRKQGFDLRQVTDPLYYYDAEKGRYRPVDPDILQRIEAGHQRF
jgi:acyl-CoA synthetase (AMP-forming)/AMP-acid ligase II